MRFMLNTFAWGCLLVLLVTGPTVLASTPEGEAVVPEGEAVVPETAVESEEEDTEDSGEQRPSMLDRHKNYVDTRVQRASQWADSFFDDPNYEAEAANSQIRIRPELYYRSKQHFSAKLRVRLRINLPSLGRRVSLVAGADEDDDLIEDSTDDSSQEGIVGLQFFMRESTRWNTSFTAGIKFNDVAGVFGPRVRYEDVIGNRGSWRFTQSLRWQTNNYWQINSRLDLNRVVSDRLFFRQTFDGRWRGERSDEEGYRTQISSFLTQSLGSQAGLQYEISTVFHTRPDTHVDKYTVAVRYRKRTKRPWLYYEIIPQISWDEEYDYDFNPGLRLRLEIFYGGKKSTEFWRREAEDSETFRW